MGGSKSPWCRGKDGQEHELVLVHDSHPPHCQPLRDWVRERITGGVTLLHGDTRKLFDEWECFHREVCLRCRKITGRSIFKDECPTAISGAVPICDPPQLTISRRWRLSLEQAQQVHDEIDRLFAAHPTSVVDFNKVVARLLPEAEYTYVRHEGLDPRRYPELPRDDWPQEEL